MNEENGKEWGKGDSGRTLIEGKRAKRF